MKSRFFYFAACALALSACTSEDVVKESRQSNLIGFENVVSKQTKGIADARSNAEEVTSANLKHFSVFAYYVLPNATNAPVLVLNDELVYEGTDEETGQLTWKYDNKRYWVPGASYYFYAYSCADRKLTSTYGRFGMDLSKGMAKDRVLTIKDYICDETHQHDLLFASKDGENYSGITQSFTTNQEGEEVVTSNTAVAFKFQHILSKIDTKFTSGFAPEYTVEIKNIRVTNIRNKGNYDPTNGWLGQVRQNIDGESPYVIIHDDPVLVAQQGGSVKPVEGEATTVEALSPTSEYAFVMPYNYTSEPVTLSFEIQVKKDGILVLGSTLSGTWTPNWVAGHHYTYTIVINGDAANLKPIMFTTDSVDGWTSGETPADINFSAN